jgi:hypothetical protein
VLLFRTAVVHINFKVFHVYESVSRVYVLLAISPASDCVLPTFRNPLSGLSSKDGCGMCFADVSEPSARSIFKGWTWNVFCRRFGTLCQVHFKGWMWNVFSDVSEPLCQVHLYSLDVECVLPTFRNPLPGPSSKAGCGICFSDVSKPSVRSIFKGWM